MKTNLIRLIRDEAPPHPACFDTQQQWVEFSSQPTPLERALCDAEDTGKHSGKRATRFAVCYSRSAIALCRVRAAPPGAHEG